MSLLDESQRDVVNSPERRLFVEAPAGCGKTTVMVEKLVSDLISGVISYPKRALALTFSVNAARKMKNDIQQALDGKNQQVVAYKSRVDVLNYHALSRRMLLRHGAVIFGSSVDVNALLQLDESSVRPYFQERNLQWSEFENDTLISFSAAVKRANSKKADKLIKPYCDLVRTRLMPNGCITYNAILALAIELLEDSHGIRDFYRLLYPYLIVDEAQDTNILGYRLLMNLIGSNTRVCMFGDSLQRIYGFIGAIPNFVNKAKIDLGLKAMELSTNHRFLSGSSMQLLDKNIRENIRNPLSPAIQCDASVPLFYLSSVEQEAECSCRLVSSILEGQIDSKVAILVRSRSAYSDYLMQKMKANGLSCFNGLFRDEDREYIDFNRDCLSEFDRLTGTSCEINFSSLKHFVQSAEQIIASKKFVYGNSYQQLLEGLLNQVNTEYRGASPGEKYQYVRSVFENRSLRHVVDYIEVDIVLMTMHTSKGLQWDYVLIPELMQWVVPLWKTCKSCSNELIANIISGNCCYRVGGVVPQSYKDELCLFYVAVTRARRSVVFLTTSNRINSRGELKNGYLSCFATLKGIATFTPKSIQDIIA
jgi:putative ATP-dependent DNA helicase